MAASSPRFKAEQVKDIGEGGVSFTTEFGGERVIALADLKNVELNRACSVKFPEVNGKAWFGVTTDRKREALRTGVAPEGLPGKGETTFAKGGKEARQQAGEESYWSAQETKPETKPETEYVFQAETGGEEEGEGSQGTIDQAVTNLVQSLAGGLMDEDKVRKIAADVLNKNVAELLNEATRPQVNHYAFKGLPEVTIERRTHEALPEVLLSLSVGHHVWLVGPAGTGKSTIARDAAEALGVPFYSISCHGQMTASQVYGYMNAGGKYVPSLFRIAYEQGGVFLFDEIDSGSANVLAAMNQALSNGTCAFPDGMVETSDKFFCIGAGNTFGKGATAEYSGRAKIDEATIDRFDYLWVDYDRAIEREMAGMYLTDTDKLNDWLSRIDRYRKNIAANNLKVMMGTRTVIGGARLLSAGLTMTKVLERRVFRGLDQDTKRKVEAGS